MNLSFNITKALNRQLHVLLQDDVNLSTAKVLCSHLYTIQDEFIALRDRVNRNLSYTSQTIVLEFLLNKVFNNSETGIFIENASFELQREFVYLDQENEPSNFYYLNSESESPKYTYLSTEELTEHDFIVHIPKSLIDISTNENKTAEVRALVNKYMFTGKRYKINNYE